MTNSPFSISGKNSPKRTIFSPKPTTKCYYSVELQVFANHLAFSKKRKEFSKDTKGSFAFQFSVSGYKFSIFKEIEPIHNFIAHHS